MNDYLSRADAVTLSSTSLQTIDRAIVRGDLPAFRIGRAVRIRRGDLERWLTSTPMPAPLAR